MIMSEGISLATSLPSYQTPCRSLRLLSTPCRGSWNGWESCHGLVLRILAYQTDTTSVLSPSESSQSGRVVGSELSQRRDRGDWPAEPPAGKLI